MPADVWGMALRQDPEIADTAGLCHRNALHVIQLAWSTQPEIGFDAAGVRWLDRYIAASRPRLQPDMVDEFVYLMGCFYGECLIAAFSGTWEHSAGHLGIKVESLGYTYPFRAIERQLELGDAASVMTAYSAAIDHLSYAVAG